MTRILTIGWHDWSGRQGIGADHRIFQALGVWGFSAVTEISAGGPEHPVASLAPAELLGKQLSHAREVGFDAVKIGRLGSPELADTVAKFLESTPTSVIFHPSSAEVSTRDSNETAAMARHTLMPLTTLLVTTTAWAQSLVGFPVAEAVDVRRAARTLGHLGSTAVFLTTSGEAARSPDGFLWDQGHEEWIPAADGGSVVGVDEALSAVASVHLARGSSIREAVHRAQDAVSKALRRAPDIGWEARVAWVDNINV